MENYKKFNLHYKQRMYKKKKTFSGNSTILLKSDFRDQKLKAFILNKFQIASMYGFGLFSFCCQGNWPYFRSYWYMNNIVCDNKKCS